MLDGSLNIGITLWQSITTAVIRSGSVVSLEYSHNMRTNWKLRRKSGKFIVHGSLCCVRFSGFTIITMPSCHRRPTHSLLTVKTLYALRPAGRAVVLFSQNGHASFIPLHRLMLETLACLVWSIDHDTWYVFLSGLDSGIIYITRYDRIKLRSVCATARESSQKSLQLKLTLNANTFRIQFLAIDMAPVPMPVFTPPPDGPSSDADVVSAIRY